MVLPGVPPQRLAFLKLSTGFLQRQMFREEQVTSPEPCSGRAGALQKNISITDDLCVKTNPSIILLLRAFEEKASADLEALFTQEICSEKMTRINPRQTRTTASRVFFTSEGRMERLVAAEHCTSAEAPQRLLSTFNQTIPCAEFSCAHLQVSIKHVFSVLLENLQLRGALQKT
ncbi:hypothetical protein DNTS_031627 [Danionella cerebrum]|uniref:Uncharacterized protein n=1 Tax=Danionella cerebrum TaxID=2873325 RepID=A0A553QVW0_9TELE|nr:hypothetical protein DNTS_031627 [Danionella translucida]